MKFAKVVFWIAGIGRAGADSVVLFVRRYRAPGSTSNHPSPVLYGFAGVTMAWQFAFFAIATNPVRFRPMMIPSVIEKLGYVMTVVVLRLQGRLSPAQLTTSAGYSAGCAISYRVLREPRGSFFLTPVT